MLTNTPTPTFTPTPTSLANNPPLAVADTYSTAEDTPLNAASVLSNDSDPENNPLTAVLDSGPANGTVTLNTDGSFIFTPVTNFSGSTSFTYRASDGAHNSNTVTVIITITPVNDPPVAAVDRYSVNEDTTLNSGAISVLGNDTDVDSSLLTAVLESDPENGSLSFNSNGTFVYNPNTNFFGTDTFTYHASDGALNSGVTTVIITVGAVNDLPVAMADTYSISEDRELTVPAPGVLSNDRDVENDPLAAERGTGPSNGSLSLNSNGSFTYIPNADFDSTDTFIYYANDGTDVSTPATVTINVVPENDPPELDLNGPDQDGSGFAVTVDNHLAVPIVDSDATLVDIDNATLVSLTVTLSDSASPDYTEVLSATTDGTPIEAVYSDTSRVLSLTGPSPLDQYRQVLRTVNYDITDADDSVPLLMLQRNVIFVAYDGAAASAPVSAVVSLNCGYYCATLLERPATSELLFTAGLLNIGLAIGLALVVDWPAWLKRSRRRQ
jgi:VCBS repeat-containing protein